MSNSRLPEFYKQSSEKRLAMLAEQAGLTPAEQVALQGGLTAAMADQMVENAVGVFGLPLGVAVNFAVNGRDVLIPMAIEEPSVVAGASLAAKLARAGGGFFTSSTEPLMIAQIQLLDVADPAAARLKILEHTAELLDFATQTDPIIAGLGGGARELDARILDSPAGPLLIVHLIFDCRNAMGANTINTAAEKLAPRLQEITGGRAALRILSNLADRRLARARCAIPPAALAFTSAEVTYPGEVVRDHIIEAGAFAAADPYRAATHNKGIMNGIDAVVIATGNDWRAIEAGAHAYAARNGRYTALSTWGQDSAGNLSGALEMPMAVGLVGGATKIHPTARAALKLLGVQSARELAEVIVAVGLAQNLAAIRALATEGIQRGHMRLHTRVKR